jgi:hypothetical protein
VRSSDRLWSEFKEELRHLHLEVPAPTGSVFSRLRIGRIEGLFRVREGAEGPRREADGCRRAVRLGGREALLRGREGAEAEEGR